MAFAYCPGCLVRVELNRTPKMGQQVTCWCCSVVFRVTDLNPLQLDWVTEAACEGWEDDWEVELEQLEVPLPGSLQ